MPADAPVAGARYQNAWILAGSSPRAALGRFVAEETWPLDEGLARETPCSKHVHPDRDPDAPAVTGVYSASPGAASALGLQADEPVALWVVHEPDPAPVATVDVDGLKACCAESDCDATFVGEILSGRASLFRPDGESWVRAGVRTGDFGFRLAGNPWAGPDCGLWRQHPPRAREGDLFLGTSNATFTEDNARTDALSRATRAAREALRDRGESESRLATLREERWCVESFPGAGGTQHVAYVLVYLPESAE